MAGRQVFGKAPVPPIEPEPRQIFGGAADDAAERSALVAAAGFPTSVFDAAPASPLFADRAGSFAGGAAPGSDLPESLPPQPRMIDGQQDRALTIPAPEPVAASAAPASPDLPALGGLELTDLAKRLQDSMRRRRAARQAAEAAPRPVEETASSTEGVAPLAPAAATPSFAQLPTAAAPAPAPEAVRPEPAVIAQAPFAVLPPALRPLSFEADGDDDDDTVLASLLPPRSLGAAVPVAAPQAQAAAPEVGGNDESDEEGEASDEGYGSLLSLSPAAPVPTSFVRIEDPQDSGDAIEPVVIFPGQAPHLAPGATSAAADEAGFRRFDAPAAAGQGQPIAASAAAPSMGSDEADQALRAALANLQRMSGAA